MTIMYSITPLVQVLCIQFSSLTIIYFILGVRSGSLKLLVPMSTKLGTLERSEERRVPS